MMRTKMGLLMLLTTLMWTFILNDNPPEVLADQTPAQRMMERSAQAFRRMVASQLDHSAKQRDIRIFPSRTVTATRSSDEFIILSPADADRQPDLYAYVALPSESACVATLPHDFYWIEIRLDHQEPDLAWATFYNSNDDAALKDIPVRVTEVSVPLPSEPTVDVALNPGSALFGRWYDCSDGLGHCGYALTLTYDSSDCH